MPEDPVQRPPTPDKIPDDGSSGALRVAFFVASFPELSETFITRQAAGLLDRGHDVRIFAHAPNKDGPAQALVERRALRERVTVLDSAAAPTRQERRSRRRTIGALARSLRPAYARATGGWGALTREASRLASHGPFDVVHCHYGNVGLRYAVAARVWQAPLVVSFYGYDASSYPRERGTDIYAPLFARAGVVASLSAHMDTQLRALGCPSSLLRRVPLTVDPGVEAIAESDRERPRHGVRLLTVARLVEKKGIEHALRAVALAAEECPSLCYDVIGEEPLRARLEWVAATLGITQRVRFLGARSQEEVIAAMREADLFLLPSVTAANGDEEGTPTVLLEASWSRLPVLSTRHAGIPEIVRDGETGVLVAEGDATALANALRALLRTPEWWPSLGEAGHRLVAGTHTMPAVAERLERIYRELR
jgi:colanic acid/amylovoran biosynthesis glycosyltransferase